jgi:hypothetical protein
MSFAIQKLNYKVICKRPIFLIMHLKPNAPNKGIKRDGGENLESNLKGNPEGDQIAHLQS